jgi:hypothetical protein
MKMEDGKIIEDEKEIGNTVKPVYNGHPWDPQKAAVVYR